MHKFMHKLSYDKSFEHWRNLIICGWEDQDKFLISSKRFQSQYNWCFKSYRKRKLWFQVAMKKVKLEIIIWSIRTGYARSIEYNQTSINHFHSHLRIRNNGERRWNVNCYFPHIGLTSFHQGIQIFR